MGATSANWVPESMLLTKPWAYGLTGRPYAASKRDLASPTFCGVERSAIMLSEDARAHAARLLLGKVGV